MGGDQPRRPWCGYRADLLNKNGSLESGPRGRDVTYKPHFTSVNEWLCGEPFPHECARGPIVDRVNQPTNIVFNW